MIGMATATFLGVSKPIDTKPSISSDRVKIIVVADNIFLAHRQSIGALFDSIGTDATRPAMLDAIASTSFDDDVEHLLDHGW